MHFGITEKPTRDSASLYNNVRFISKVTEDITSEWQRLVAWARTRGAQLTAGPRQTPIY